MSINVSPPPAWGATALAVGSPQQRFSFEAVAPGASVPRPVGVRGGAFAPRQRSAGSGADGEGGSGLRAFGRSAESTASTSTSGGSAAASSLLIGSTDSGRAVRAPLARGPEPPRTIGFASAEVAQAPQPAAPVAPLRPTVAGMLHRQLSGSILLDTNDGGQLLVAAPVRKQVPRSESPVNVPTTAFQQLLGDAAESYEVFDTPLVRRAFSVAWAAHEGQLRKSGEPVLAHLAETAKILGQLGLDEVAVAAGLLHDVLDDTPLTEEELRSMFPAEVVDLVVGVSKMSGISQLVRSDSELADGEVSALRAMLLAMVDVRVVLIKLADRLHNMRTVDALPLTKRHRMAAETLSVFAPLANRLGVWSIKAELEDLCFAVLHPQEHDDLAALIQRQSEQADIISALNDVRDVLEGAGVEVVDLSGRPKNLYSIWQKMEKKGVEIDDILDVRAVRIIVKDKAACYNTLRAVHKLWEPLEGRLKDYVRSPKANQYRSLHTVVRDHSGRPLEVQIRTNEMHKVAEFGVAAHWRYKEGKGEESTQFIEQQVAWARFMVSWGLELSDSKLRAAGEGEGAGSKGSARCMFPTHSPHCQLSFDNRWPPCVPASDGPIWVLVLEGEKLRVVQLPAAATMAQLQEALGSPAANHPGLRVLVNSHPRDDMRSGDATTPLGLAMGDLLQVLTEDSREQDVYVDDSPDAIAMERARLARRLSVTDAPVSVAA